MENTFSTSKFVEIELIMQPVTPGTKATPRPADRPREIFVEDEKISPDTLTPEPPTKMQQPENAADSDD